MSSSADQPTQASSSEREVDDQSEQEQAADQIPPQMFLTETVDLDEKNVIKRKTYEALQQMGVELAWHDYEVLFQEFRQLEEFMTRKACVLDVAAFLVKKQKISARIYDRMYNAQEEYLRYGHSTVDLSRTPWEGGTAVVFQGMNHKFHREVAIKLLKPSHFEMQNRFFLGAIVPDYLGEVEDKMTGGEHFIRMRDFGTDPQPYYEMPIVHGEPLNAPGVCPMAKDADIADVLYQVAVALSITHSEGIVHRDLKPSNLMRKKDGTILLTDFDMAKILDVPESKAVRSVIQHSAADVQLDLLREADDGAIVGTPSYMPPEPVVTPKWDMRSLAGVLYYLKTGKGPYEGAGSAIQVLQAVKEGLPDLPAGTSSNLNALYDQIRGNTPEERSDAHEFLELLVRLFPEVEAKNQARIQQKTMLERYGLPVTSGLAVASFLALTAVLVWVNVRDTNGSKDNGNSHVTNTNDGNNGNNGNGNNGNGNNTNTTPEVQVHTERVQYSHGPVNLDFTAERVGDSLVPTEIHGCTASNEDGSERDVDFRVYRGADGKVLFCILELLPDEVVGVNATHGQKIQKMRPKTDKPEQVGVFFGDGADVEASDLSDDDLNLAYAYSGAFTPFALYERGENGKPRNRFVALPVGTGKVQYHVNGAIYDEEPPEVTAAIARTFSSKYNDRARTATPTTPVIESTRKVDMRRWDPNKYPFLNKKPSSVKPPRKVQHKGGGGN